MGKNIDAIKNVLISVNVALFFPVWALIAMKERELELSNLSEEEIERMLSNNMSKLIAVEVGMVCVIICGVWILELVI